MDIKFIMMDTSGLTLLGQHNSECNRVEKTGCNGVDEAVHNNTDKLVAAVLSTLIAAAAKGQRPRFHAHTLSGSR